MIISTYSVFAPAKQPDSTLQLPIGPFLVNRSSSRTLALGGRIQLDRWLWINSYRHHKNGGFYIW